MKNDTVINGKGFKIIYYKDFLNDFMTRIEELEQTKVVAYRNDKVTMYNEHIRKKIYNNPIHKFIEGELIYMNDTYLHKQQIGDKKSRMKWTCYNSDEYRIVSINDSDIAGIHVNKLYIDKKDHIHLAAYTEPYIYVVSNSGMNQFQREKSKLYHFAVTAQFNKPNEWRKYYEFIGQFGNVSYGYCYTAYKIQGSTYKTVYVDVNDIVTVGPLSNKRKLQSIYTALTRASDLCIFLKRN
jgi:hypothetical protein